MGERLEIISTDRRLEFFLFIVHLSAQRGHRARHSQQLCSEISSNSQPFGFDRSSTITILEVLVCACGRLIPPEQKNSRVVLLAPLVTSLPSLLYYFQQVVISTKLKGVIFRNFGYCILAIVSVMILENCQCDVCRWTATTIGKNENLAVRCFRIYRHSCILACNHNLEKLQTR